MLQRACSRESSRCRYCYEKVNLSRNVSVCRCNSPLCALCMQSELLMTSGRANHIPQCSVCHFQYSVRPTRFCSRNFTYWLKCAKFVLVRIGTEDILHGPLFVMMVCFLWIASLTCLDTIPRVRSLTERVSSIFLNIISFSIITVSAAYFTSFAIRVAVIIQFIGRFLVVRSAFRGLNIKTLPSSVFISQYSYLGGTISSTVLLIVIMCAWLIKDIYSEYRRESTESTMTVFVENQGPFVIHI